MPKVSIIFTVRAELVEALPFTLGQRSCGTKKKQPFDELGANGLDQ